MQVIEKKSVPAMKHSKYIAALAVLQGQERDLSGSVTFKDVKGYVSYIDPSNPDIRIHSFLAKVCQGNYPLTLINDSRFNRTEGLKLSKDYRLFKEDIRANRVNLSRNHSGMATSTEGTVSYRAGNVTVNDKVFIRNGGHTDRIFKELAVEGDLPKEQWVRMELFEGKFSRMESAEFSINRNKGNGLKESSVVFIAGKTKWIKDIADAYYWGEKVAWQEGDKDKLHPIDVTTLIVMMDICNAKKYSVDDDPHMSQIRPKILMQHYKSNSDEFKIMGNLLPDLVEIHEGLVDLVIEVLGKNVRNRKYSCFVKTKTRGKFSSPYSNKTRDVSVNDGALSAVLSTTRAFMQVRGDSMQWKGGWNVSSILAFYRKHLLSLIEITVKNPDISDSSTASKNGENWLLLTSKVELALERQK